MRGTQTCVHAEWHYQNSKPTKSASQTLRVRMRGKAHCIELTHNSAYESVATSVQARPPATVTEAGTKTYGSSHELSSHKGGVKRTNTCPSLETQLMSAGPMISPRQRPQRPL